MANPQTRELPPRNVKINGELHERRGHKDHWATGEHYLFVINGYGYVRVP